MIINWILGAQTLTLSSQKRKKEKKRHEFLKLQY